MKYDLSQRIHFLRRRKNLTQASLAKNAAISQSTIAQIEKGGKDPSISTLQSIADALKVHISILFIEDISFNEIYNYKD